MSDQQQDQPAVSQDKGSFLTGFSLGLFAGAFGYFFFATDKGKKMGQQFKQEWDQNKHKLLEKGVIADKKTTFRGFVKDLLDKVGAGGIIKPAVVDKKTAKKSSSRKKKTGKVDKSSSAKKNTTSSSKKFKGV